jgi:hypothetical protein
MSNFIPNWSQLNSFIECESFYSEDENVDRLLSINELEISDLNHDFSFLCPHNLVPEFLNLVPKIVISARFWIVYKPDFSISTWFPEKPDEISQSGLIQIEITEISEEQNIQSSFIQVYVKAKILDILPFNVIADRFTPECFGEPYSFMKNLMTSYLVNNVDMTKRSSGYEINSHVNLISGYDQISSGDLTLIEFIYLPSDYGGWIIVQERPEYEYPVLVVYTEMSSNSWTFVGHRPLTAEEWLFFKKWQRQVMGLDREIKQIVKERSQLKPNSNYTSISIEQTITQEKANYDYW